MTFLEIFTLILALVPAFAGFWWYWRLCNDGKIDRQCRVEYILLASFASIASLAMVWPSENKDGWIFYMFGIVESFTTLLIIPLMYDIAVNITHSIHKRVKRNLWFLPFLVAGVLNTIVFEGLLFLEVVAFVYMLIYMTLRYKASIESYYVDVQYTDYNCVMNVLQASGLSVFFLYIELVIQRDTVNDYLSITLIYLFTFIALVGIIGHNLLQIEDGTVVLNLKETNFSNQEIAEMTFEERSDVDGGHSESADSNTSSLYTEEVIQKWVKAPGSSYLKEGITISQVADEMRISPRVLSAHLNTAMQQNFNSWINGLRIEEAKHLFMQDKTFSASYVALKCGFADAAMLSKNFKRITGMTITEFKRLKG